MGERYVICGFHDVDHDELLAAFEVATERVGGRFHQNMEPPPPGWSPALSRAQGRNVAIVMQDFDGGYYLMSKAVAQSLGCVWIQVRVQEGTLWDYSLYRGGELIDNYSSYPEYWDIEPDPEWLQQQRGSPRVLSEAWGVPQPRIERYLIQWKMGPLPGHDPDDSYCLDKSKAYPEDQHPYGEWLQMYDFMRALGIPDPHRECRQHAIWLPERKHWKQPVE